MLIRYGYRISIETTGPLALITQMTARPERRMDLRHDETLRSWPEVAKSTYTDGFGNLCTRMTAPGGLFVMESDALIADSGLPDPIAQDAQEIPVSQLPDEVLIYLLASRYCETDLMGDFAWETFGALPPGWARVQAVVDWVHANMRFDYQAANPRRTAYGALQDRAGVCRDFAHLAITICRCLNIPARYVNGYLGDIGIPPEPVPMDFAAWMQVWLSGRWWTFDPRNHIPRVGRIVVGVGRDATDVALVSSFGQHRLKEFKVWTDEVTETAP
ncbi:transglutaminase family protein [Paracoccus sp. (in: a-proteobacteria)]|uniref:transglutaminase-like domain-containing protein n=1 Tax=Paracoccus sp. TaxID=267 RepID=UPI00289748EC|nr:transglutaminase family protein [Paracoccus sp. (in: a-proteobacteria)]